MSDNDTKTVDCESSTTTTGYMKHLVRLDRISAWVLFISLMVYFISGYGMTKGLIDPELATTLHLSYLTYFVLAAFTIHTAYAIHLAFKRWQIWNGLGKTVFILFYLFFTVGFIYVDRFYIKNGSDKVSQPSNSVQQTSSIEEGEIVLPNTNPAVVPTSSAGSNGTNNVSPTSQAKTFNAVELSKYNGQNGQPSYVAIDGSVYDVSSKFINGTHKGCVAGREITNSFYSIHMKAVLNGFPVVGDYIR